MSVLRELWAFVRFRKKLWLGLVLLIMLLFGLLVGLTESSAISPFLYTFF
jgi:hypothetical protein